MSNFDDFLSKYHDKKLAIVTHNKADVDAISSAYAISRALPNSTICTREEMRQGARMLAEDLGIEVTNLEELEKDEYEGIVVVDTSAYTLVPEARDWKILLIVDHHRADGKDMDGEFELIDRESPSCAEICANMIKDIDPKMAFGLCVGIIADAARFKTARPGTFETLSRLMRISGREYSEMLKLAEPDPTIEAKYAMLNCLKKMEFIFTNGYMVATSESVSNESDAASLLAEAADVAFVAKWKEREQETRISARARHTVKVPLNEVMGEVGKIHDGAGGGHPKAAGASLKCHTEEALKTCVEIFNRKSLE